MLLADALNGFGGGPARTSRDPCLVMCPRCTGLGNLPCHGFATNATWLEVVFAATDLICWAKLICFADSPNLVRCEIAAFRYRALHIAARVIRSGRQTRLQLDKTWRWAAEVAAGYHRLRAAFP